MYFTVFLIFLCFRFTPDFSLSRTQRSLTLHTSLAQPINFTLQATVPPHLLLKCSAALPRPEWEPTLYTMLLIMLAFVLAMVVLASYFEANRVMSAEKIRIRLSTEFPNELNSGEAINSCKVFDLKNLDNDLTVSNGTVCCGTGSGGGGGGADLRQRTNGFVQHTYNNRKLETTSAGNAAPTAAATTTYVAPVHHPSSAPPRQLGSRYRRRDNSSNANYFSSYFYKSLAYARRVFKWPNYKWSWLTRLLQFRWRPEHKTTDNANNKKSNRNSSSAACNNHDKESKAYTSTGRSTACGDTGGKTDTSRHGNSNNSSSNSTTTADVTDQQQHHQQQQQQTRQTRSKQKDKTNNKHHQFPDLIEDVVARAAKASKSSEKSYKSDRKKYDLDFSGCDPTEIRPDLEHYEKKGERPGCVLSRKLQPFLLLSPLFIHSHGDIKFAPVDPFTCNQRLHLEFRVLCRIHVCTYI